MNSESGIRILLRYFIILFSLLRTDCYWVWILASEHAGEGASMQLCSLGWFITPWFTSQSLIRLTMVIWGWSPSFTVWVRSALISPTQGGSSGRNYSEQKEKKSLVHYFLGELHDISVQLVGHVGRRGPCSSSFSKGATRTPPGCIPAPWALLGLQVSLWLHQGWGRGKVGQLVESSFLRILRAAGHCLWHKHKGVIYEISLNLQAAIVIPEQGEEMERGWSPAMNWLD